MGTAIYRVTPGAPLIAGGPYGRAEEGRWWGAQGLEKAGDIAEAVMGAAGACVRQWLILADGLQLEVLPIHGNVGGQGLQVQITEVRLWWGQGGDGGTYARHACLS